MNKKLKMNAMILDKYETVADEELMNVNGGIQLVYAGDLVVAANDAYRLISSGTDVRVTIG